MSGRVIAFFDPAVGGTVNINDQGSTAGRTYRVQTGRLAEPKQVDYNFGSLNVFAGTGNDQIIVEGYPAGRNMSGHGGGGDDTMILGNGSFTNLLGSVSFAGGPGAADRLAISNVLDPGVTDATITSTSFSANGGILHRWFNDVEQVDVALNQFGPNVRVDSAAAATTVAGTDGADHLVVGNGDYSANIRGPVTFNGGGGADSIVYDDASSTGNDGYSFSGGNQVLKAAPAGATITNSVEHKTLQAGSGNNTITVAAGSQDIRIHANAGNDTVNVGDSSSPVTVNTGPEDPAVAPFGDSLVVNSDAGAGDLPVTASVDQDDAVRTLSVLPGGTLRIATDVVLRKLAGGQFSLLGTIDLAGGALLGGPTQAALRTFLVRGYNGGAWNGTHPQGAINSSLAASTTERDAVGYGLGSEIAIASIGIFSIAPTDLLARYALSGDANLDATVNLQDFNRLAGNFGQANRAWVHGDATYDGTSNLIDFNLLAGNFGRTFGAAVDAKRLPRPSIDELDDRPASTDEIA